MVNNKWVATMYLHFIKARQNTEPCTMKNTRGVNHDEFVSLCVCVCTCILTTATAGYNAEDDDTF